MDGVDMLSLFGGTVGFWLGWSVLSSGQFLICLVKSIITNAKDNIKSLKNKDNE